MSSSAVPDDRQTRRLGGRHTRPRQTRLQAGERNGFNVFIEALYHLNTTGKPRFPHP
jgi:hypothetical protein